MPSEAIHARDTFDARGSASSETIGKCEGHSMAQAQSTGSAARTGFLKGAVLAWIHVLGGAEGRCGVLPVLL